MKEDRRQIDGVNGLRKTATRCRERQRSEAMKSANTELTGRDNETETNRVMMREKMDGF